MTDKHSSDIDSHFELLDSLLAHIAIIDTEGVILRTNKAWQSFEDKGSQIKRSHKGENYFEVLQKAVELGNDYALKLILGLKKVIKGEQSSFTLNYPMQSAGDTHWFKLTARPGSDKNHFVMIHEDISSTIKAEQQSKESKNRYQIQFEQSLDGILITDTQGNIIDANPTACSMLGHDKEELLSSNHSDIIDVDDPRYQEALEKREKTGIYKLEVDFIHKDGTKIPGEISSHSYRNHNGKVRAIVTFRDISHRKTVEKELLKTKSFTESALNSNPGIFFVLDQEANLVPWNENFVSNLGYTSQELSNKNVLDFVVDDQKTMIKDKIGECLKTGDLSVETKLRSKDGQVRDYHIQANRFEQDDKIYIVGSGTDITENKKAELEIRKSQLMLQQLFDNAPIGISIVDTDNNIKQVNKSFRQMFNYAQEEVIGKNIDNLIIPNHKADEAEYISEATRQGQSLQTESVRLTKDNQEVPVLIGGIPVTFQDEVIAIYGMYVDISEQTEYRQKIETTLREKETLLAELHHRVKNNLALINSLLELQLFDSDSPKLNRELTSIKNRILTIASIHEVLYKNGNLSRIPFKSFLQELIATADIQNELKTKEITLNTDLEDIFLDLNQSIPCGLFLNELFSLIFDHTNSNCHTDLNIRFREYGPNVHIIVEGTDIIDCPKEVKENQSLHNILLDTLVMQLEGKLLWPTPNESKQKFELIFTKEMSNSPASNMLNKAE